MRRGSYTTGAVAVQMFAWVIAVGSVTLLLADQSAGQQKKPYPKPQIASAEGRPAPDFTLADQDGDLFKLSGQRGRPVLIYFYRGYW